MTSTMIWLMTMIVGNTLTVIPVQFPTEQSCKNFAGNFHNDGYNVRIACLSAEVAVPSISGIQQSIPKLSK